MPRVVYILPDASRQELQIEAGTSVMQAATAHGIDGIVAECGGCAMCATCHVYVEDGEVSALPEMSEDEDELLDCTASPRKDTSRLSCQLVMTSSLDGLVVRLPEAQT